MKTCTKEALTTLFLEIEEDTATQAARKTESAYRFLRKEILPLSQKQFRFLHYVIVYKAKDGNGAYSYQVLARYNGNMITLTAATLDEAICSLIAIINGESHE